MRAWRVLSCFGQPPSLPSVRTSYRYGPQPEQITGRVEVPAVYYDAQFAVFQYARLAQTPVVSPTELQNLTRSIALDALNRDEIQLVCCIIAADSSLHLMMP